MQLFAEIINGLQPLNIFAKSFILDVSLGSHYASDIVTISQKKCSPVDTRSNRNLHRTFMFNQGHVPAAE